MPRQLHCIGEKLSSGCLPRDQNEESLICHSLVGRTFSHLMYTCVHVHSCPSWVKIQAEVTLSVRDKDVCWSKAAKMEREKTSAMGVMGRSCPGGHCCPHILQSPDDQQWVPWKCCAMSSQHDPTSCTLRYILQKTESWVMSPIAPQSSLITSVKLV